MNSQPTDETRVEAHRSPFQRLVSLLYFDVHDLLAVALFALVAAVLNLATPLAVESLVNTVAWGTYLQPLFVLTLILFAFLSFAALLKMLQIVVVEVLQRRLFVRVVGELAYRFSLAQRDEIIGEHPSELANRYFDIVTIQKSVATLLLDGISIALQTVIGLVLLAFYHPFLLGFDIVLLVVMTVFTYLLGRGGVRTAIAESIIKYRIAHWLQDVISSPTAFNLHGGNAYAMARANQMTVEYLEGRSKHFHVLGRQYAFSLTLMALASTALLGVGGWLVLRGELTLGQLVASELVVTVIVGAFAKIGKSLESFYDLLAAVDKVGHMLDVPCLQPISEDSQNEVPAHIRCFNLSFAVRDRIGSEVTVLEAGSRVAVVGPAGSGKTKFIELLAGLREPEHGFVEIANVDARQASRLRGGSIVSLARPPEIFCGTLLQNVRLGRGWITAAAVRIALEDVGLWQDVIRLEHGVDTVMQTGGYPLCYSQCVKLMLARALVSKPNILLIDSILDLLGPVERWQLWNSIVTDQELSTVVIATHDQRIIECCQFEVACAAPTPPRQL